MIKEGLYRKYLLTIVTTLLLCTAVLGLALLFLSAKNFNSEKEQNLRITAEGMREMVSQGTDSADGKTVVFDLELSQKLAEAADSAGVTVFVADADGNVLLCTEKECTHTEKISQNIIKAVKKGGERSWVRWFGEKSARYGYTIGLPLAVGSGEVYVFTASPIQPLYTFLIDLFLTFMISSGVMIALSSSIVFYATRQLTKPISALTEAAERFGKGDFDTRVVVEGSDEIAELARAMNNMADSLNEIEQNRRSFVANVSHELRTPMTTIGGYVDGILDGTIPPENQAHYLEIVSSEVKRLARLTTSLLDVERMEDVRAAEIENVNAWDVVLSVLYSAERRLTEKEIHVSDMTVQPQIVLCNADMLYQVVYNLLDNAIKFTPNGGEITVTVQPDPERGGMTDITIRNTGVGIAADELEKIFSRFYKTDKSRSLDRTGTGLGLYIVRSLVNKMGGRVSAQSVEGEWAQFCVELKNGTPTESAKRAKPQRVVFGPQGEAASAQREDADKQSDEQKDRKGITRLFDGLRKGK